MKSAIKKVLLLTALMRQTEILVPNDKFLCKQSRKQLKGNLVSWYEGWGCRTLTKLHLVEQKVRKVFTWNWHYGICQICAPVGNCMKFYHKCVDTLTLDTT